MTGRPLRGEADTLDGLRDGHPPRDPATRPKPLNTPRDHRDRRHCYCAAVVYASSSPAESSGSKPLVIKSKDDGALKPGLELLVHNISHADMVVRLQETPLDETSTSTGVGFGFRNFLARPQFNAFMPISVEIFNAIAEEEARGQTPGVIACTSKYKVQYPTGIDLQSAGSGGVEILPKASDVAAGRFSTAWSLFHLKKPADEKGTKWSWAATSQQRI